MVNYNSQTLDLTFAALADPTRRAMLTRLAEQEAMTVSEIAQPFAMTLPAAMKHLAVLERANLVIREKTGRTVHVRLNAVPMETAMAWLARYERFWSQTLDALESYLEQEPTPCPQQTRPLEPCPPQPASRSAAGSRARRPKSSPPGPSRKR